MSVYSSRAKIFSPLPFDAKQASTSCSLKKQHGVDYVQTTQFMIPPSLESSMQEVQFQQPQRTAQSLYITPQFKKKCGPSSSSEEPSWQGLQVDQTSLQESSAESFGEGQRKALPERSSHAACSARCSEDDADQESNQNFSSNLPDQKSFSELSEQMDLSKLQSSAQSYGQTLKLSRGIRLSQALQQNQKGDESENEINLEVVDESQEEMEVGAQFEQSRMVLELDNIINGVSVKKFGRNDKFYPSDRVFQLTPDLKLMVLRTLSNEIRKVFSVRKIAKLEKGATTSNLKRFKLKHEQQAVCLSIFMDERTIDLMAKSIQERDFIVDVLQSILEK